MARMFVTLSQSDRLSNTSRRVTQAVLEALESRCLLSGVTTANPFHNPDSFPRRSDGLPIMHSNPSAGAVIFLDYDGDPANSHDHHENAWPVSDRAGNGPTFNADEQENIIEAWRHVSMYYSMFNVDVTTEQPPIGAGQKPVNWVVLFALGGTGSQGDTRFPHVQGSAQADDGPWFYDGIVHEVGHNFKVGANELDHKGNFDSLNMSQQSYGNSKSAYYNRIMGAGEDGKIPKWVDSFGASTVNISEDEIAEIAASLTNAGVSPFRTDESNTSRANAATLTSVSTGNWAKLGIINSVTDTDYFKFTPSSTGYYSFMVGRDAPSPVDLSVQIEDSSGTPLASEDGDTTLFDPNVPAKNVYDQNLSLKLTASTTYYIRVMSHGNYCDMGQYVVRVGFQGDSSNPWQSDEMGFNMVPGYMFNGGGTYTIAGSGHDIWGRADGAHIAYQTLEGDGYIQARVLTLDGSNPSAQAGITIRESLNPDSKHVTIAMTEDYGWQILRRTSTGGTTAANIQHPGGGHSFAPMSINIDRHGNTFEFYVRSGSSGSWGSPVATYTVSMSGPVYIGLIASGVGDGFTEAATGDLRNEFKLQRLTEAKMSSVIIGTFSGGVLNPTGFNVNSSLSIPTLTMGTTTEKQVSVSWTKITGSSGYIVERSQDGVNFMTTLTTTSSSTTTLNDTGLTDSEQYFYRVRTRGSSSQVSNPSTVKSAITRPGLTTELRGYSVATNLIVLDWDDVDGETGYRILRSGTQSGTYSQVGTVGRNKTIFRDTTVSGNQTYWYKIETLGSSGYSLAPSNTAALKVRSRWTSSEPTIVSMSPSSNSVSMSWNLFTVSGVSATSYRIYRSTDSWIWTEIANISGALTYTDTGLNPNTSYGYRIVASNIGDSYSDYAQQWTSTTP